uniref:DUF4071 domain-containing protein n=1 Tax=Macrostomum lignano TaxID=282301 RepID=A0A1I8H2C3_9PLAT
SMLSESDRLVAYTVAAASPTGSVGTGPSGRRHCIVLPDGAGGGGGRLYGRLKRLVKEQRRSALARRQAAYLAEVRAALNQRMRPGELRARLAGMRERLDDPDLLSTEVLLTTLLAYRKAQDYSGMVTLIEHVGEQYNSSEGVQYYYAFALNRRNLPGDRQRALQVASAALEAADRRCPLCWRCWAAFTKTSSPIRTARTRKLSACRCTGAFWLVDRQTTWIRND